MDSTANPAASQTATALARLQKLFIGALFAGVLLVPKILNLRRDERSWTAFRVLLGVAGAGFVILPLAFWNSWLAAIAGLAMFLTAALLPPASAHVTADDKARELGALVVVNGGKIRMSNVAVPVRLLVGAENIWALDSHLKTRLIVPVAEVSSVYSEETENGWVVRLRRPNTVDEFAYRGVFAEHFAKVTENTILAVMRPSLPVHPKARAASA
ncbi:MAG TPA: hypothetical protein VH022_10645 [Candidatus Acidoferrum sp.]|jgi:hypothetical protein|nr:hypothetical protein [Candidatus Acidoferrum sp.]